MRATYHPYFIPLNLIILIIFGEEYEWVPCKNGMALPQVAGGGDSLQILRVAAYIE
jgi:hypothetical protein